MLLRNSMSKKGKVIYRVISTMCLMSEVYSDAVLKGAVSDVLIFNGMDLLDLL